MRPFPRDSLAADDVVSPEPLLSELREIAHVANHGLDIDNLEDDLLAVTKFETGAFHAIQIVQSITPSTQTLVASTAIQQWLDVPTLTLTRTTEDGFLQIEAMAAYQMEWTNPTHSRSISLGIFVDGGLVAIGPPTGVTGKLADNVGRGGGYVCGILPIGAGSHSIKIRWVYLATFAVVVDMDMVWLARKLWAREVRR